MVRRASLSRTRTHARCCSVWRARRVRAPRFVARFLLVPGHGGGWGAGKGEVVRRKYRHQNILVTFVYVFAFSCLCVHDLRRCPVCRAYAALGIPLLGTGNEAGTAVGSAGLVVRMRRESLGSLGGGVGLEGGVG